MSSPNATSLSHVQHELYLTFKISILDCVIQVIFLTLQSVSIHSGPNSGLGRYLVVSLVFFS